MVIKVVDPTTRTVSRSQQAGGSDVDAARTFGGETTAVVGAPRVPNVAQYYAAEGRNMAAIGQTIANVAGEQLQRSMALRDAEEKERMEQAFIDYKINLRKAEEEIGAQWEADNSFLPDDQDVRHEGIRHTLRNVALDQFDPDSGRREQLETLIDNYERGVNDFAWTETLNGRRTDIAIGQADKRYDAAMDEVTSAAKNLNALHALEEYQNFMAWGQTKGAIRVFAGAEGQERLEAAGNELIEQYVRVATRSDLQTARDTLAQLEDPQAWGVLRPEIGEATYDELIQIAEKAIEGHEKNALRQENQYEKFLKERSQEGQMYVSQAMDDPRLLSTVAEQFGIDTADFPLGFDEMMLDTIISAVDENGVPILRPQEAFKLQDQFRRMEEKNEVDSINFSRYVAARDANVALNPDDKADVAAADIGYESLAAAMESRGMPEADQTAMLTSEFTRTGIVPTDYRLETTAMVNSENPDVSKVGLARITSMIESEPLLAEQFDDRQVMAARMHANGATIERATAVLQGQPPEPQLADERADAFDEFDDFEDELNDMIGEQFDYIEGFTRFGFFRNDAPEAPQEMVQAFKEQARQYFQISGDKDTAYQMAMTDMRRSWGRTDVEGEGSQRMMYLAPESLIGRQNHDVYGPMLYEDLKAAASAYDLQEGEYFIQSDIMTAQAPQGTMPSYAMYQKDENGFSTLVYNEDGTPARWQPDPAKYNEVVAEFAESERLRIEREQEEQREKSRRARQRRLDREAYEAEMRMNDPTWGMMP